jgi:TonB family protein
MTLWMLYAILFGTLAAGAGLALERGARAVAVPTRFIWLALLLAGIGVPFTLPSLTHRPVASETVEFVPKAGAAAGPITTLSVQSSWLDRFAHQLGVLDGAVTILWYSLSALFLCRFLFGVLALRRKRGQWIARDIVGTTCFVTPDIGPAVVAIPDARIVVPEWVLSLDDDSLATVIRHERHHKTARDGWLIVTGSVGAALMPWNPAVWFVQRRMRLAVEMDCDARVLAEEPRVDRYGSLLLAIAQRPRLMAGLGATLTESTSDLERRIDAMTARPPRNPRMRALVFSAAGTAAIAIACSMPAPDMVAPHAADPLAGGTLAADVYFDFQVEKPASASPANMPPRYPDQLRAANIEGTVLAKFVVDTTGRADMTSFAIIKSDHAQFTTAVREALPNLRFYPAQVGGRKVKQLVQMPFSFSLVRKSPLRAEGVGTAVASTPSKVIFDTQSVPVTRALEAIASRPSRVAFETPDNDSMPQFLDTNAPPVYPNQLRAANFQGMVQATFVVRPDGSVDMGSFMVTRSDHEAFTAAVRKAAEGWRFRPAMKDGKPVARLINMPFMFTLAK